MKVKDLLEILQDQDPEAEVIIQKDAEGNGYSPLAGSEPCRYLSHTTYSGEILHSEDTGWYSESDIEASVGAVVVYPIN